MATNLSVQRFRKLTEDLKAEVHALAVSELNTQADSLVELMKSVAPRETGALEISIKKIPGKADTQVRIVAGGRGTTDANGRPYDHARAVEFGTVNMPAKSFFFPSYRLRKKKMISTMKRKITASIKKRSAE